LIGGRTNDANPEMSLRVSDDFGIAGMVGGFDRDYSVADLRTMFANIFGQLGFCARRSKNQDFAGIADGIHDLFEEMLAFMDMPAANRIGLGMNMPRRHVGMKNNLIGAGEAEMEDVGLHMVDPDGRVEMVLHFY